MLSKIQIYLPLTIFLHLSIPRRDTDKGLLELTIVMEESSLSDKRSRDPKRMG